MKHRMVEVPPERFDRWVSNFGDRHGGFDIATTSAELTLTGTDGCIARCAVPWPPVDLQRLPVACLARHAAKERSVLLVSVRRGGYGAAVAQSGRVLFSKHGTKYVQGKTAAGGWSQQRFARRRQNQAAGVVAGAVAAVERMFEHVLRERIALHGVVPAGDRGLLKDVFEHCHLMPHDFAQLPVAEHMAIADPRKASTEHLAHRACAIRIKIDDPN